MALPVVIIAFQQAVARLAQSKIVKDLGYNLIIAGLIEVVTGEMDAIKALDAKVQALVDEPFRTGLDQLRRAVSSTRKEGALEKAYDSFLRAKNIYRPLAPINSARAAIYCGGCSEMLQERPNALALYEDSYTVLYDRFMQIDSGNTSAFANVIYRIGTCNVYPPAKYSRRQLLDTFIEIRKKNSTETQWPQDKPILWEKHEMLEQLRPVASLLATRQSKLKNLRAAKEFTWEYDAEQFIKHIEILCGSRYQ